MKTVERIIEEAKQQGACKLADNITDVEQLAHLFFKPQGREFCIEHNFPSIEDFRILKAHHCSNFSVFCDCGHVSVEGGAMYAAVGKTQLEAKFSGVDRSHLIIVMHGAKVKLHISNHAVVRVERTDDCEVTVINEDKTGIVLW